MSKIIFFLTSTLFILIIFNEINYITGHCNFCTQYCCGNTCCRSDHCCGKKGPNPTCRPNDRTCCGDYGASCPPNQHCTSDGCWPNNEKKISEYANDTDANN
ncbi:hypothetical protein Mgra_00006283 [Meloidogyne graminicola]|uniref:Uncharacterized protein n=1 Tax=Meloidogyne graminicola TaxID=189291 RepID=A0A8S9ZLM1_9BILA|nr:hypothetical protein Mgra_00006283 [Meloidogyne graminicola]